MVIVPERVLWEQVQAFHERICLVISAVVVVVALLGVAQASRVNPRSLSSRKSPGHLRGRVERLSMPRLLLERIRRR